MWHADFVPDRFLLLAFALFLDALVGDMAWVFRSIPHPVALLGRAIEILELKLNRARRSDHTRLVRGGVVVTIIVAMAVGLGIALQVFIETYNFWLAELFLVTVLVAQRSLYSHVRAVAKALDEGGLDQGRAAVAHIVGRDPKKLDAGGVARSAIESLAENFADGVVAPVFWYLLFGLPGLFFCKAVSTMDSMLGYRNERYNMFGRTAARLDDAVMWVPARLSVIFLIVGACVTPSGNPFRAIGAIRSDAAKHPSINAGWPEAAMAGALDFALGGPRVYEGGVEESVWIGSGRANLTPKDVNRALYLFVAACLANGVLVLAFSLLAP
ncbi:MAG: cobalamin biosynthesis protein CobD [Rhodospirillaceae bacterium]|nr:cobalamin biosynthesis protein CobD [Rhodospirillaceae bacterium]HAA90866.1 cobalamin biosynthesis protein CobD [Rhodospirillaceae bacterium]